ncbi:hypothetical protein F5I97DRAFT_1873307 [Phlebopus sp. FC_14]|nr:hypothetical protein F5I97DRAFT_1873307 [Phlebopus sp. FC_14]
MSINVLHGKQHTHYDDIESFFYILLLFFISYKGPLPTSDLASAHKHGFSQVLGWGRAQNICDWPAMFKIWSESMANARLAKLELMSPKESVSTLGSIADLIHENWGSSLSLVIGNLIGRCLKLFHAQNRLVTHKDFIGALDEWLKAYPAPPDGCNNCLFKDLTGRPYV